MLPSSSASRARTTIRHRPRPSSGASRSATPASTIQRARVLLTFAGELPPSAIPSTMIIDRQGRLAVRVLSGVSKITLVDMINDVADGR